MEPLINGREAAKLLSISYPTLMHWVSEGHGPPYYRLNELSAGNLKRKVRKDGCERRVRRLIRFKTSELDSWLQDRIVRTQQESLRKEV